MQKVEGSSPFIRSSEAPLDGAFYCLTELESLLPDERTGAEARIVA